MQNAYAIASFRSRQQVLRFEDSLRREGISTRIVTTPRAVALGCGLPVQFDLQNVDRARAVLARENPGNLIGLYRVEQNGDQTRITPIRRG